MYTVSIVYRFEGDGMRIIIDAMGGDHAPQEIVAGVLAAMEKFEDTSFLLTGDEDKIRALLGGQKYDSARMEIVPTTQVIETVSYTHLLQDKKGGRAHLCERPERVHRAGDAHNPPYARQ